MPNDAACRSLSLVEQLTFQYYMHGVCCITMLLRCKIYIIYRLHVRFDKHHSGHFCEVHVTASSSLRCRMGEGDKRNVSRDRVIAPVERATNGYPLHAGAVLCFRNLVGYNNS